MGKFVELDYGALLKDIKKLVVCRRSDLKKILATKYNRISEQQQYYTIRFMKEHGLIIDTGSIIKVTE